MSARRPTRGSKKNKSVLRRYGVPGLLAWASWPVTVALALITLVVISWQAAVVVAAIGILTGVFSLITVAVRAARAGAKFYRGVTTNPWDSVLGTTDEDDR